MEITIKGEVKEITALVSLLHERWVQGVKSLNVSAEIANVMSGEVNTSGR